MEDVKIAHLLLFTPFTVTYTSLNDRNRMIGIVINRKQEYNISVKQYLSESNNLNGDKKFGECYYIRMDRNDEIISTILEICKKENIRSATFSGIGGCKDAEIQTFIPETGSFEEQRISGMLELVSLNGNVVTGENNTCYHHTHAVFSYKDGERHCMAAGHMKSITVLYTAEIELHPVTGGTIRRKYDPETGTGFWDFN